LIRSETVNLGRISRLREFASLGKRRDLGYRIPWGSPLANLSGGFKIKAVEEQVLF
jgi:hypothetical protein